MKGFLASIFNLMSAEIWLIGIFMIFQPTISGNRYYFFALAALFFLIYIFSKNLLQTTWLTFLASIPFSRGKYFDFLVVPASYWGGEFDLGLRVSFLFSDFLLALAAYLILSKYKKLRSKYKISNSEVKIYLFLFLFVLVSFISSYMSFFPFTSFYFFLQLSKFVALFFVAKVVLANEDTARKSFQFLVLFLFLNSLVVVSQYINQSPLGLANIEGQSAAYGVYGLYSSEDSTLFRAGGFSPDPNVTATFLAISFPVLFTNSLMSKNYKTRIKWLVLFILGTALILTASRTLWAVTTFVGVVNYLYLKRNYSIKIPPFIKKNTKIFLVLVSIFLFPFLFRRLATLVDIFDSQGGGTYRIEHIKAGIYFLKKHIFGSGLGTFSYSMAYDLPPQESGLLPADPHNLFAQIGAETGFLGLIFFSLFLFFLIRQKYKESLKNPVNFSVFLSLSSYLLSAFFFPWFLHPLVGPVFWIVGAYPLNKS